ncbi:hypothetical protein [Salinibacterium sp. NK8237]|nr:hypothetical protein [Salinibacterium sp. NK8237]
MTQLVKRSSSTSVNNLFFAVSVPMVLLVKLDRSVVAAQYP